MLFIIVCAWWALVGRAYALVRVLLLSQAGSERACVCGVAGRYVPEHTLDPWAVVHRLYSHPSHVRSVSGKLRSRERDEVSHVCGVSFG